MSGELLKIGFIGGGKMAQCLAKGFISAGLTKPNQITSSCHPLDTKSAQEFKEIGAESCFENTKVVENSEIVLISVKPQVVPTVLDEIRTMPNLVSKLFVSIAMGVTIGQIEKKLPQSTRVMRVMSNNPVLVRTGASVIVNGSNALEKDEQITKKLFESVGTCERVEEQYLDVITALSGSGPAYIYVLIESLTDGGVKMGLPRDLAHKLATQTVLGAGRMVRDTNLPPSVLKDSVTSSGGCTSFGLHFLEERGFRSAIIGAIQAATERCKEVTEKNN